MDKKHGGWGRRRALAAVCVLVTTSAGAMALRSLQAAAPATPGIQLLRTPGGGIQPQTALDGAGVLHMIYFVGDAGAGDIEYVRRKPGAAEFSAALRVNNELGSALAAGTVRGPQLAIGRNGRVHVIWLGSRPQRVARGRSGAASESAGPAETMPVYFSRLNDAGMAFEPQRNLMQYASGTDGGVSVAADAEGNVYAVWHASGSQPGEDHRRVYLARSRDDGKTFAREAPVSPTELGACGCCGMRAFADRRGTVFILYRAAGENIHRDMTLLSSTDHGATFRAARVGPWELNACPMSTAYLSENAQGVMAAWEKAGQVYFDSVNSASHELSEAVAGPGIATNRKHPAVAANESGQVLLVWTEGTGWSRGGSLAWQLYDKSGKPVGDQGHAAGVPVWGLPSAFAERSGNFTIVY